MNKSPNPQVVGKIWDRVTEWKEELRLAISDQPANTEEAWKPVNDHFDAYHVAFNNMMKAISDGDQAATEKYFKEAEYHEMMQRKAGADARAYFVSKAASRVSHKGMIQP